MKTDTSGNDTPAFSAPRAGAAIEFVVAVAENDVIGRDNRLPWRLPADLRRFKAITLGHDVLMGRKTHESIGRALPGRRNLVLTRQRGVVAPGCTAVATIAQALAAGRPDRTIMVIGGGEVYRLCLPFALRIHLTLVHTCIAGGDAHFKDWHDAGWRETARERHQADAVHEFDYSFITLDKS